MNRTLVPLLTTLALVAACGGNGSTPAADERPAPAAEKATAEPETSRATPESSADLPPPTGDETIALFIANDGYRIGFGRFTYYLGLCDGAYDRDALEDLLGRLAAAAGNDTLELSAATGVAYAEIVSVMEVALAGGQPDIGLVPHDELPARLIGDVPARAANAACDGRAVGVEIPPKREVEGAPVVIVSPDRPGQQPRVKSLTPPIPLPENDDAVDLDAVVVIAVSTDGIFVDGTSVAALADAVTRGAVPALVTPLSEARANGATAVVLQADRTTDAEILIAILSTARSAGIDQVMFAVNAKR